MLVAASRSAYFSRAFSAECRLRRVRSSPILAVIFLKATHAQLTEAGFRNLDPLHRLFLEYRPEPEDEESGGLFNDLSVFSPRYHPSTQPLGLQIALFCSSDKGLVLREGHQMESELCGRTIPPGTALVVVAVKKLEDGTRRGRVALKDRANLQALGWVTLIFKDGSSSVTFTESNAAAAAAALQVETVAYQREESDFVPVPRWRSFEIGSPLRDVMASIGDAIVRGTRDFR